MTFTDQEQFLVTEQTLKMPWGGHRDARFFRCSLCGHRFEIGEYARWQYSSGSFLNEEGKSHGMRNFHVCEKCDGPDVLERWKQHHEEFYSAKFWDLRR